MKDHRLSLVVGLTMALVALALAGFQSSLVPTATSRTAGIATSIRA